MRDFDLPTARFAQFEALDDAKAFIQKWALFSLVEAMSTLKNMFKV